MSRSSTHPILLFLFFSSFEDFALITANQNLRYINKGYSKFGAITIEKVPESGRSSLSYRLFVDGVEAWNTTVLSPEKSAQSNGGANLWDRLMRSR
jgi:hypothetical protein